LSRSMPSTAPWPWTRRLLDEIVYSKRSTTILLSSVPCPTADSGNAGGCCLNRYFTISLSRQAAALKIVGCINFVWLYQSSWQLECLWTENGLQVEKQSSWGGVLCIAFVPHTVTTVLCSNACVLFAHSCAFYLFRLGFS